MDYLIVLKAIPSTESGSFRDLCNALGDDRPEKGDKSGWRDLFHSLRQAERQGDVEISWLDGNVDAVQLTEQGAAKVRAANSQTRE